MNNEDEINELLNLKLEKLDKLDLVKDDGDDDTILHEPLEEVKKVFKQLDGIPGGRTGFMLVSSSPEVLQLEKVLARPFPDRPSGTPLLQSMTQLSVSDRTDEYKSEIQVEYDLAVKRIEGLYRSIRNGETVSHSSILEIVEYFMSVFIKDRCILLNLCHYKSKRKDYLFNHMLHVCLVAINIATASGYSRKQVLEVGEAGLLADTGMLLISDYVRFNPGKLSEEELFDVHRHPMVGLYALEKIENIPLPVAFCAYQHHERLTGAGYPKNRKGRLTHNYSKIIAIADVYQALCSHRPYRKAFLPHQAMIKILKMARLELLDQKFVDALIRYVSFYPVGSFVRLADGRVAKVVRPNENSVEKPVVSVIADKRGNLLPADSIEQINLSIKRQFRITGAVDIQVEPDRVMYGL
ncbi:HD-GYP domain-containing protein [Fibrobacterota bacterium]